MAEQDGKRNLVGGRVRKARLSLKPVVAQEDLTNRMANRGVYFDRSVISRIEAGDRYVKDYELAALAKCLKVSVSWLMGEKGA